MQVGPVPGTPLPTTDPTQLLQRIERSTAEIARWMKYLTGAVVILIVVTALLFV